MKSILRQTKGITLIALVITIIVLIILAGVSIAMLTGDNGILTQANIATVKQDNGTVLESTRLKLQEYEIERQTEKIEFAQGRIEFLKNSNIMDEVGLVNVQNLVGQKLKTGNGSNGKDVYMIEDNHLNYYDKDGNKTDLGDLGDLGNPLEETDPSLFEVNDEGKIRVKDYDAYYNGDKKWTIENVVIPSEVEGKKVTQISEKLFFSQRSDFDTIKTIVIPEGVTHIKFSAFYGCRELENINLPNSLISIERFAFADCRGLRSITIPNSVIEMGDRVFSWWSSAQMINLPFKESELPYGWDSEWYEQSKAQIVYAQ